MHRSTILAALLAALFAVPAQSQKSGRAEILFESARQKETLEGDVKGAIREYEEIVKKHASDRSLTARALLRMAECYQKLGDAESRRIYERILRDYADQKEAAVLARARLGGAGPAAGVKGDRPVWTGPNVDIFGRISPDGRFLTYVDWFETGNLMMHDMVSGADYALTKKKSWDDSPESASYSIFSPDGKQLAYEWGGGPERFELRVADLVGATLGEHRRLLAGGEFRSVRPFDWSPDGKWIAVQLNRVDQSSQIGMVAVEDGSVRVLRPVDWRGPTNMFFSKDGKFIAFDLPAGDSASQRDVFVVAIDGSGGSALVEHPANDTLVGFSADGRQLLFASDRTGSVALWAQPFAGGKSQGSPVNVKSDFGSPWIQGSTRSGALYVTKVVSDMDVCTAPVDLAAGKLVGAPTCVQGFPSRGRPDWSSDGRYLSYVDCGTFGGGVCSISIRSMQTGEVRKLQPALHYFAFPRWSPDGSSFLTTGTDTKGQRGLYLIDANTARTTFVAASGFSPVGWSADGRKIFYRRDGVSIERDLASGNEREVARFPASANGMTVSPDGRQIAYITTDAAGKSTVLMIVPVAGGNPRELMRVRQPESLVDNVVLSWTLGGSALVVTKRLTPGAGNVQSPTELWLAPVTGGQPRKLEIDASKWDILGGNGIRMSPDGRRIAFLAGERTFEVWALEGFLARAMATP